MIGSILGYTLALLGRKGRQGLWNGLGNIWNGLGNIWNRYTGSGLTTSEREANQFNAEEAQKNRAWQEEMSNTAYQRQVRDMQAAGLNPALMYGGAGSSGASSPSGAAASSVSPSSGNISDLLGNIMDMALLGAQIKNINADTRQKNASATNVETLTPVQVREIDQKIKESNQNISESEARTASALAQSIFVSKQTQWYDALSGSQVALNQAYESLADAQKANNEQQVKESEQKIKGIKQDMVESMARCAVYAANAGYLDQATINAMEELKLIELNRASKRTEWQINEKILQNYDTDKWFLRAQQGMSAVRDLGLGVGSVASGGLFTSAPRKIGY